jgi:predicted Zn-dependent protease
LKELFQTLGAKLFTELKSGEELGLFLSAEQTDYVRFNQSRVRQSTFVDQKVMTMTFQSPSRKVVFDLTLSGVYDIDFAQSLSLLERAREEVKVLPQDDFVSPMKNAGNSHQEHKSELPTVNQAIEEICRAADHVDLAGFLALGLTVRASLNHLGQNHWFSTESFFFDYSLYTKNSNGENKAAKGTYAGTDWDSKSLAENIRESVHWIELLKKPTQSVPRGSYRVYMAPAAVADLVGMLNWGGLSLNSYKNGSSPLNQLIEKERFFHPAITVEENFGLGLSPRFNSLGEVSPEKLKLIENGQLQNLLVSSRSAQEYSVSTNFADKRESCRSMNMLPGTGTLSFPSTQALDRLGTGLYLGNLHYLNWSDLKTARITGMTRFACFWVEKGQVVGPIQDLRFDESLYRCLGSEVEALTDESFVAPEVDTYYQRSLGGKKAPGLLLKDFTFTL